MKATEVLKAIGLTEDQLKGVLKGEILTLQKQEIVLRDSIESMAKKTNDIYLERQQVSQAFESEKLGIKKGLENLIEEKTAIKNQKTELLNLQRDTSMLREKLNADKEMFRKEKEVISQLVDDATIEKKRQKDLTASLLLKEQKLDKLEDELYLREENLIFQDKEITELKGRIEDEFNTAEKARHDINVIKESLASEREFVKKLQHEWDVKIGGGEEKLKEAGDAFRKEKKVENDSLRRREYAIVEKEKVIKRGLTDLRAQKESLEIERAKQ